MKRSMLVRDYMLSPTLTLSPDMSLLQAAHLLPARRCWTKTAGPSAC